MSSREALTFRLRAFSSLKEQPLSIPESGDKIQGFRIVDFGKKIAEKEDGEWILAVDKLNDLTGSYILLFKY